MALLLSVGIVAGAASIVARGYTRPNVITDGWSSSWSTGSSTAAVELRLGNDSPQPIEIVGATIVGADGSPLPYARVASMQPLSMDGLLPDATAAAIYSLPMTVEVDCATALADSDPASVRSLLLHTTGTFPYHDQVIDGDFDVSGFCRS